jgi:hypothetical protein
MRVFPYCLVALATLAATPSFGQNAASICSGILDAAARNISVSTESSDVLSTLYDQFCDQSGNSKTSSSNAGLEAVVKAIPARLTLSSSDSSVAMKNFCGNYNSTYRSTSKRGTYQSTVVEKALDTLNDCVRIARSGNYIHHRILNDEAIDIYMQSAVGSKLTIQGVATSANMHCSANTGQGAAKTFDQATQYTFSGYLTLNCARDKVQSHGTNHSTPADSPPRETNFAEGTVSVSTTSGPYAVFVPQSARLAQQEAEQIQKALSDLKETLTATNNNVTQLDNLKRMHLECKTVSNTGQSAQCPQGYSVTGCAAGKNYASTDLGVNRAPNGCFTHLGDTDWTSARCCRATF